jgi:hypothetical protein
MRTLLIFEDCPEPLSTLLDGRQCRVVEVDGRALVPDHGGEILRLHDLVPYDQLYRLNQQAKRIAASWYMVLGKDATWSRELGISIGDCLRFPLALRLARYLRYAALLGVLARERSGQEMLVWGRSPSGLRSVLPDRDFHSLLNYFIHPWVQTKPDHGSAGGLRASGSERLREAIEQGVRSCRVLLLFSRSVVSAARRAIRAAPTSVDRPLAPEVEREDRLRIFTSPDTVLNPFIEGISAQMGAHLVRHAQVRTDWEVRYRAFRDYTRRAERITDSPELAGLCGADAPWLLPIIQRWLREQLPANAAHLIDAGLEFAELLHRRQIAGMFMPMAWAGVPRMQLRIAQAMGIPTSVIQDGVLERHETTAVPEVDPDFAVVLGPSGTRWFVEAGVSPERILPAGEHIWRGQLRPVDREPAVRADAGVLTVLYCAPRPSIHGAQYSLFEADEEIEIVCNAVASFPQLRLVLRVHPRTVDEFPGAAWKARVAQQLFRAVGDRGVMGDELQQYEAALGGADLVICYPSTTLVQAAHAGKHTIMCDFSGRQAVPVPGVPVAFSHGQLVDQLRAYTQGADMERSQRAMLKEHLSLDIDYAEFVGDVATLLRELRPDRASERASVS